MLSFLAIHIPEGEEADKATTFPFKLKKFMAQIRSQTMLRLPRFYAANCSVCFQATYYSARNRQTTLDVIAT